MRRETTRSCRSRKTICVVRAVLLRAIIVAKSLEEHLQNEREDVAKEVEICRRQTRHGLVIGNRIITVNWTNHLSGRREKNVDIVEDFP